MNNETKNTNITETENTEVVTVEETKASTGFMNIVENMKRDFLAMVDYDPEDEDNCDDDTDSPKASSGKSITEDKIKELRNKANMEIKFTELVNKSAELIKKGKRAGKAEVDKFLKQAEEMKTWCEENDFDYEELVSGVKEIHSPSIDKKSETKEEEIGIEDFLFKYIKEEISKHPKMTDTKIAELVIKNMDMKEFNRRYGFDDRLDAIRAIVEGYTVLYRGRVFKAAENQELTPAPASTSKSGYAFGEVAINPI
jgi:hypothetical protein